MIAAINDIFSYSFLLRALVAGLLVSLTSSLVGVSLVLKRFSMIGDGLSHVGFGALGVAALLSLSPMALTIPVVIACSFILLHMSNNGSSGDSKIALISSSALAIGVIAISIAGVNTDLNSFLFGSILAVSKSDAWISIVLSVFTLGTYIIFYNQIYITTFDPAFSKATGIRMERYTFLLSLFTALTIVIGMRILGSLLVSSLIIFPAMSSMKLFKTYKRVTVFSAIEAEIAFFLGFLLSYILSWPTGASIVVVHLVIYICATIVSALRERSWKK